MNLNKVILISVDGMRPDGFLNCGNPYIEEIMKKAYYTLDGKTVFPSVTLPCHMSLFHSVPPERHGITTNTYIPMARPVNGLFEQLKSNGAVSAMFYGWEPLRDVSRPSSLKFSEYKNAYIETSVDSYLADRAIECAKKYYPNFIFLYMVDTDEIGGHDNGWMTEKYLKVVSLAVDNIRKVIENLGDEYTVIITADHGGHDRSHGTDMPEDTTIPMFYIGKDFECGHRFSGGSILDIIPTVAEIMDIPFAPEWEGRSVIKRG